MTIAFLVTKCEDPSVRYRVLQYIPFLEKKGFFSKIIIIPKGGWRRIKLFRELKDYDVVFLHRKLLSSLELYALRKNSKRLFYDFDDALMFKDSKNAAQDSPKRMARFVRTVRSADLVIAGNEYLKSFAIKENPKTFIIPTPIDMQRYLEKPYKASLDEFIIGWIGSCSTLFYLKRLRSVWDALFDKYPQVRLKIISNAFFDCDRMPVIKKEWKYEEEIDDLHTLNVGLMPLTDDPWSRGKCGFKLLQYMAVGVPAVCSPVGVNREIVADGLNGFWACNEAEWIDKIGELIKDIKLRDEMGKRARKTVREQYSVGVAGKRMLELFELAYRGVE